MCTSIHREGERENPTRVDLSLEVLHFCSCNTRAPRQPAAPSPLPHQLVSCSRDRSKERAQGKTVLVPPRGN